MAHRSAAVLVPVKAFDQAKQRLAPALDAAARAELARSHGHQRGQRGRAAAGLGRVRRRRGGGLGRQSRAPSVLWRPGRGLNGAVADGVDHLAALGFDQVIVAHADLPHAVDLAWVADFDGVTLVPDRHDDGTNVACVPTGVGFSFAYGAQLLRPPPGRGRAGWACRCASSASRAWAGTSTCRPIWPRPSGCSR